MESRTYCGPTPMRIGPWKIGRSQHWGLPPSQEHAETGQVVAGPGAVWHRRFMLAVGVPIEMLDRRAGERVTYVVEPDNMLREIGRRPVPALPAAQVP